MQNKYFMLIPIFVAMLILVSSKAYAAEDEYIVKIKTDLPKSEEKITDDMEEIKYTDDLFVVDKETLNKIDDSCIENVEKSHKFKTLEVPNDALYSKQYYLNNVDAPYAWNNNIDSSNVIAIVDTGLYTNHNDLNYSNILPGVNVFTGSTNITDTVGHGTTVTGIINAKRNNSVGIAGICKNTKILPIKVFDEEDETDTPYVISGIAYAATQKKLYNETNGKKGLNISVINMSIGSEEKSEELKNICEEAKEEGIILISAAGNEGDTSPQYPAQYTIGVGATGKQNEIADFSQIISSKNGSGYQNKVWVCAPGVNIWTTLANGNYNSVSGTSFAAPIVSSLAAMCKSVDPDMSHVDFMKLLKETSVRKSSDYGNTGDQDKAYGYGLINFKKALSALKAEDPGHIHAEGTPVKENEKAATCTSDGSYDLVTYCTGCGTKMSQTTIIIPKLNHNYGEWIKLDNTYHQRVCMHDSSHKEKENHSWNSGAVIKKATCTQTGTKRYTCKKCAAKKTVVIAKLNHNYGKWSKLNNTYHKRICLHDASHSEIASHKWVNPVIVQNATYHQTGIKKYTCSACHAVKNISIPALTRKNISKASVELNKYNYTYSGKPVTATIASVYFGKKLTLNKDYKYSSVTKTNAGTYAVSIQGINAYHGTKTVKFVIKPAELKFKSTYKKLKKSNKKRTYNILKKGCIKSSKKISGSKYLSVSKNKIKIKKKTPKGSYKIQIYFQSNTNYKSTTKTFKVKIN